MRGRGYSHGHRYGYDNDYDDGGFFGDDYYTTYYNGWKQAERYEILLTWSWIKMAFNTKCIKHEKLFNVNNSLLPEYSYSELFNICD